MSTEPRPTTSEILDWAFSSQQSSLEFMDVLAARRASFPPFRFDVSKIGNDPEAFKELSSRIARANVVDYNNMTSTEQGTSRGPGSKVLRLFLKLTDPLYLSPPLNRQIEHAGVEIRRNDSVTIVDPVSFATGFPEVDNMGPGNTELILRYAGYLPHAGEGNNSHL